MLFPCPSHCPRLTPESVFNNSGKKSWVCFSPSGSSRAPAKSCFGGCSLLCAHQHWSRCSRQQPWELCQVLPLGVSFSTASLPFVFPQLVSVALNTKPYSSGDTRNPSFYFPQVSGNVSVSQGERWGGWIACNMCLGTATTQTALSVFYLDIISSQSQHGQCPVNWESGKFW